MAVFALKRNSGGFDTARWSCEWRRFTLFHAFYPSYRAISGDLDSRFFTRDCSCLHYEWLSRQVNTVLNSYYRWLPHPISYSCFVDSHFPAFSLHGSDPCRFVRTQSPFVCFFFGYKCDCRYTDFWLLIFFFMGGLVRWSMGRILVNVAAHKPISKTIKSRHVKSARPHQMDGWRLRLFTYHVIHILISYLDRTFFDDLLMLWPYVVPEFCAQTYNFPYACSPSTASSSFVFCWLCI